MQPHLLLLMLTLSFSQTTWSQSHIPLTDYPMVMPVDIQHSPNQKVGVPNSNEYPLKYAEKKIPAHQPAKHAHTLTDEHIGSAVLLPNPLPPKSKPIGHTTRQLLQYQTDTTRQANDIPMLGVTATKSWNRYLTSFDQPLPEWFTEHLNDTKP